MSSSDIGTTSIPAPSFGNTGFVAPTAAEILSGALADMNAAFGGNLNTDLATPQGQLATSYSAALANAYAQFLLLLNGIDPPRAFGRLQDAIGNLYFLSRKGASSTVVTVTCTGVAGTIIPQGTLIQDSAGYYYAADAAMTISSVGTASGTFSCTTLGAIDVGAGSVSLYQSISGLSSVTNPTAGVTGTAEETAKAFEARRAASVELNAVGSLNAIAASVANVSGVTDVYVCDNPTSEAITTGGVTLGAHALFVCANGGTDTAVAQAILAKKPPGVAYCGTTTLSVVDPNGAYTTPPTYSVTFTRPTSVPLYIVVTLTNNASIPSTATSAIQTAILGVFDGFAGARIGKTLYASSFYSAVAALGSWVEIVEITLGTSASPTAFTVAMNIDEIPVLSATNISVSLQS